MRSTTLASEGFGGIVALLTPVAAAILAALLFLLASCATPQVRTVTKEHFNDVPIAVQTGCVDAKGRPSPPPALRDRYSAEQWSKMPPGAKTEAVRAQAGRRMNYEDDFNAATGGCK